MRSYWTAVYLSLAAATPALAQPINAESRFETDSEGWRVVSASGQDVPAPWNATGGYPGGGLNTVDDAAGVSYWQAPAAFRGDHSGAYGGTIAYEVFLSGSTNLTSEPDIILSGGGLTLYRNHPEIPDDYFVRFYAVLSGHGGWHVGSLAGPVATEAEVRQVISDITDLRILADYRSAADAPRMDNAVLRGPFAGTPSSDFELDNEDWKNYGDSTNPVHEPDTGVDGGGCIRSQDFNDGVLWQFQAPAMYLGDLSRFSRGTINFSYRTTHNSYNNSLIVLRSPERTLVYTGPRPTSLNTWTSVVVPLSPSSGATSNWQRTVPGPAEPATQEDFDIVLRGLHDLRICGEWSNSVDTGRLDRVSLGLGCGTSDFNGDGDAGTDADIEAFFACLSGDCCPTCFAGGADFNSDGDVGTDADIEAFFRVLGGAAC